MLSEKKVILMTRMAIYSEREGRRNEAASRYFSVDYVTHHIIGSVVCATLMFMVVVGVYVLSHFDIIMEDIYNTDFETLIGSAIRLYVTVVALYCVFSAVVYGVRYYKMQHRIHKYALGLKHLSQMAEREDADHRNG